MCARARFVAESKDCYKSYFPPNSSNTRLSPVVARHFGKRCVAPIAPVKWHKPEAMLLRLGVRERAAVELETHSHSAAVSESQSTEHTPNNLMEMLFTVQEGTRSFTHSGNR